MGSEYFVYPYEWWCSITKQSFKFQGLRINSKMLWLIHYSAQCFVMMALSEIFWFKTNVFCLTLINKLSSRWWWQTKFSIMEIERLCYLLTHTPYGHTISFSQDTCHGRLLNCPTENTSITLFVLMTGMQMKCPCIIFWDTKLSSLVMQW